MSWRPLITDPAEQAELVAIVDAIMASTADRTGSIDLLTEHAILRAYRGGDDDLGGEALAEAVASLGRDGAGPSLYAGAARVGWTVAHLTEGEDADAVGRAVEASIATLLGPAWTDYDLISGLIGFGVFALERGDDRGELAVRVLDQLERIARPYAGGMAWFTPAIGLPDWQRALCPEGYWNLGLAHGIAGVIAMLARYLAVGIEPDRVRRLLDAAVAALLTAAPPRADGRFPAWISATPNAGDPSLSVRRVAWCYGDLGVALALFAAADATGVVAWRDVALATARTAAGAPLEASGVVDISLCHGAAGAAHLFNRCHQATGDAALGDAARRWLDRTVTMHRTAPVDDVSMLVGSTGVALALHAACSDVEPLWDRLLLADLAC
jgi:hypothetical protein